MVSPPRTRPQASRFLGCRLGRKGVLVTRTSVVFLVALLTSSPTALVARGEELVRTIDMTPSKFANRDGVRIHYKSLGPGETALVFVHGWTCDLTFWRSQVPAFEGKTRILLIDLPGG